MGKHRNATQNGIFVKFMEEHEDIARGYTKRDRVEVESLWQELTQSLNSAGPPNKDANGWKRIWTEWKSEVKKKLAHNKAESRATGGGPFNKFHLTKTEEAIVQMCGIKLTVEGVSGTDFGIVDDELRLNDDTIVASTSKRRLESPIVPCTPKKAKPESTAHFLKNFLSEEKERKIELNRKLDQLISIEKENASSLRRLYRTVEKKSESVAKSIKDLKDEMTNFSSRMLKAMQEKNEIKKQQLELELLKFNMQSEINEK